MLCGLLYASASIAEGNDRVYQFDIAAGSMSKALEDFSDTSNLDINYPANVVNEVKSNGLKGSYTTEQALRQLLKGSNLSYRITGNSTVTVEKIQLAEAKDPTTMPAMRVVGQAVYDSTDPYNPNYNRTSASTATKTDTPIMETPFSVQVVPRAVMDDQQAIRLKDVTKNISGVFQGDDLGFQYENFYLRGFNVKQNVYRDGFLTPGTTLSLASVERVEVLKGPAGMLYGRLEPGGLINVVTKRPLKTAYHSLEQQFGSFDLYRTSLDTTGPIDQNGELSYRFNLEYLNNNSFRDYVGNERLHLTTALSWNVTDATQIDLDFSYQNHNFVPDNGIPVIGTRPANVPISRFFGEPDDFVKVDIFQETIKLDHHFNDDWKVTANLTRYDRRVKDKVTFPIAFNETTGDMIRGAYSETPISEGAWFSTINFNGKFNTWGVRHNVLVGGDYRDFNQQNTSTNFVPFRGNAPDPINIFSPVYDSSTVNLSQQKDIFFLTKNNWYGIYLQDQITINDQLHLLLGGRYDNAKTSSDSDFLGFLGSNKTHDAEFSQRYGILYQPASWVSLYGNFVKGFNAANAFVELSDGQTLEPELSQQYEVGVKGQWFDDRLTATLTYFDLTKKNISVPHSNLQLASLGLSELVGEARSRGIEFDFSGQITENWSVIANYAYTDVRITKDQNSILGNRLPNVPEHGGGVWTKYDFADFDLPGFNIGTGVYFSSNKEGDRANSFQLPGFFRVDAALGYKIKVGSTRLSTQFNVINFLDKRYYDVSNSESRLNVIPATSRTFLGSIKIEF